MKQTYTYTDIVDTGVLENKENTVGGCRVDKTGLLQVPYLFERYQERTVYFERAGTRIYHSKKRTRNTQEQRSSGAIKNHSPSYL